MKKFLKRHSFIIVVVITFLIAATNYLIYPVFISNQLKLVDVPVVKVDVPERTKITEEMLTTISTNLELIPANVITDKAEIIGKYTKTDYTIPGNSFVYSASLTDEVDMFGKQFEELDDGKFAYIIPISETDSQDQTIEEGMMINLYCNYNYIDDDNVKQNMFGLLVDSVKVIDVSEGLITLAVDEEDLAYIRLAQINGNVFPHISSYSGNDAYNGSNVFDKASLKQFIDDDNEIMFSSSKYIPSYTQPVESEPIEGAIVPEE